MDDNQSRNRRRRGKSDHVTVEGLVQQLPVWEAEVKRAELAYRNPKSGMYRTCNRGQVVIHNAKTGDLVYTHTSFLHVGQGKTIKERLLVSCWDCVDLNNQCDTCLNDVKLEHDDKPSPQWPMRSIR